MKMENSVPKRRHIKFRRRVITHKKVYNIQNTGKVWNKKCWIPWKMQTAGSGQGVGSDYTRLLNIRCHETVDLFWVKYQKFLEMSVARFCFSSSWTLCSAKAREACGQSVLYIEWQFVLRDPVAARLNTDVRRMVNLKITLSLRSGEAERISNSYIVIPFLRKHGTGRSTPSIIPLHSLYHSCPVPAVTPTSLMFGFENSYFKTRNEFC